AHGVAAVALRRAGHAGRLADWAWELAERSMLGLVFANDSGGNHVVVPHGAREPRLSTNPVAVGIPRAAGPHLVLDLATSTVAAGTLAARRTAGEPVEAGWLEGEWLRPMAGHKGFALALAVDVLAGFLSGAGVAGQGDPAGDYQGMLLLALDLERFGGAAAAAAATHRLAPP